MTAAQVQATFDSANPRAMRHYDAAVASFQEVNINTTSAVSYASEWKARQCNLVLSPAECGKKSIGLH